MNRDLDYVLNYMVKYTKDSSMQYSEPMLNHNDIEIVLKHIYELEEELKFEKNICSNQAQRIFKTIEYIKKNTRKAPFENYKYLQIDDEEIEELLNILKGEENE